MVDRWRVNKGMNDQQTAICPWCQTEIVWDEELGPEEQCPHCLNELGDYRSVALYEEEDDQVKADPKQGTDVGADLLSDTSTEEDLYTMSAYEVASRHLLDRQEVL